MGEQEDTIAMATMFVLSLLNYMNYSIKYDELFMHE